MSQDPVECFILDTTEIISLPELAQCCGMSPAELDELVDYNALVPLPDAAPERAFSARWVTPLRSASKMRLDFDLDLFTVAILLGQLVQIELLQRQLEALRALLPSHLRQT
jgi:chaperone modulatory protein CbpM